MANLIYKKMNDVMKEIGFVGKNQQNTAQGFKFRGIDDMINALYPALCKHGVFMTTDVLEKQETIKEVERSSGKKGVDKHVALTMRYTFNAEDGSNVSSTVAAEGLDSGDKATNKALSAALKYALIQTFSIPTLDMEEADLTTPELGVVKNDTSHVTQKFTVPTSVTTEKLDTGNSTSEINVTVNGEAQKRVSFRKPAKTSTAWGT